MQESTLEGSFSLLGRKVGVGPCLEDNNSEGEDGEIFLAGEGGGGIPWSLIYQGQIRSAIDV